MTTDSDRLEEIKERFKDFKEGSTLQYNIDMGWLVARVQELESKLAAVCYQLNETEEEKALGGE